MKLESYLQELEVILVYEFKDKSLLEEAFTHASFCDSDDVNESRKCVSYERLELIGDSVLNLMVTKELFFLYPNLPPGLLTRIRSDNTDNEKLARVAVKHGFHQFLRHGKQQLNERIQAFTEALADHPLHSHGLIVAPKILADIVESAIGAVFIDSNSSLETVWKVFKSLLQPFISLEMLKEHPVAELQDLCQKNRLKLQYVTDSWEKDKTVNVLIENRLIGTAIYGPKKDVALNRAAKDALDKIECLLRDKDHKHASKEHKIESWFHGKDKTSDDSLDFLQKEILGSGSSHPTEDIKLNSALAKTKGRIGDD